MKLIAFTIAILLFSCSTNNDSKAKKEITNYIKKNINDISSYESVDFRPIRNDSSTPSDIPYYSALEDSIKRMKEDIASYTKDYFYRPSTYQAYVSNSKALNYSLLKMLYRERDFLDAFQSKPIGFGMMHIFRKKNKKGAVVLDSMFFRFDSSFNLKSEPYYYLINED